MEKITFALDVGSGSTKLVAGYVLNEQPLVLEALSMNVPHQLENGRIVNLDISAQVIKKLIAQMEKSVNQPVSSVAVTLPPHGLQIFEATKTTNIISQQGIIALMDIKNLHNLFRKESIGEHHALLGIVPEIFEIDNQVQYTKPPIGEISNNITLTANLHFGDRLIYQDYLDLCKKVDLKIRRFIVDVHASVEMLSLLEDTPEEYVLIDIGAAITSLSFVAGHRVYVATHFDMGGRHLTDQISTQLGITFDEALRLHEQFGYDSRDDFYDGIVYQAQEQAGEMKVTQSHLNSVIVRYFDAWVTELNRYIDVLQEEVHAEMHIKNLPWLIVGGSRKLHGFADLLTNHRLSEQCTFPKFMVMGARSPSFGPALGTIYTVSKYTATNEEAVAPVTSVERVKDIKKKPSYSAYEDEL